MVGATTLSGMQSPRLNHSRLNHLLGYAVARARVLTQKAFFEQVGEPLGLRPVDFTVLMLLAESRQVTQRMLVQGLDIPPPHLTLIIRRLMENGWVSREISPTDRRAQVLQLTDAGLALAEQAHQASLASETALRERYSPAEWAMLMELLQRCNPVAPSQAPAQGRSQAGARPSGAGA